MSLNISTKQEQFIVLGVVSLDKMSSTFLFIIFYPFNWEVKYEVGCVEHGGGSRKSSKEKIYDQ